MKILVTGCSGRFGPYMVRELAQTGHQVVLFDQQRPPDEFAQWKWIEGNIARYEDCGRALAAGKFDAVLHLAAQPWPTDHPRQQQRREQMGLPINHTIEVNITGTYNMLHSAMLAGVKLFVMTGTNCAVGHAYRISGRDYPCKSLPINETHPSDVEDSYSFSKVVDERLCEMYTRVYGMRTYLLRCAGLCDEAARKSFAEKAKPVERWDWGLWAWVSREDAAVAHRLILENASKLPAHDFFFCNSSDTSALEPSMDLVKKFRPDLAPLVAESLDGHASFFSNRKLREAVGWEHKIAWRQHLGK